jgi:hypothetical protein
MTIIANNSSEEIVEAYIVCGKIILLYFSRKRILCKQNEMIKIKYIIKFYIIKKLILAVK